MLILMQFCSSTSSPLPLSTVNCDVCVTVTAAPHLSSALRRPPPSLPLPPEASFASLVTLEKQHVIFSYYATEKGDLRHQKVLGKRLLTD